VLDEELSPRERRYQRTQQAILTAARSLLAEGGEEKLSIRAIADRIDYSPAGLYEYYGSKEEIIAALCREGHRTLKRYMAQVPQTLPPGEYIVELGTAYIQFALQNPDYFLLIFTTLSSRHDPDVEALAEIPVEMVGEDSSFPLLLTAVERAVHEGTIQFLKDSSLFETAYAFWAVVHGAAMLRVTNLKGLKVDFDRVDRLMLEAFVRGLGK
jgi:AcrR family transcriptional regulator